ncbi:MULTISPECIES: hypothetical protein [Streptomyces]|uniref:hypothetical protein n=1 Tax=Streptomyces TaxID=1883 RepID=UPI001488D81E|nr:MULTISPECIES: hypothetical protein [Streptomyces]
MVSTLLRLAGVTATVTAPREDACDNLLSQGTKNKPRRFEPPAREFFAGRRLFVVGHIPCPTTVAAPAQDRRTRHPVTEELVSACTVPT